jgi:hypothetical protein
MMGRGTRLRAVAVQPPTQDHAAALVDTGNLECMLGKIKPEGDNGHVEAPPECGGLKPTPYGIAMPVGSSRPHHHHANGQSQMGPARQ